MTTLDDAGEGEEGGSQARSGREVGEGSVGGDEECVLGGEGGEASGGGGHGGRASWEGTQPHDLLRPGPL